MATQTANSESITGVGIGNSAIFGAIGGYVGGKFVNPYLFTRGPWFFDSAAIAANADAQTIGRGIAGAGIGNEDPFTAPPVCDCK